MSVADLPIPPDVFVEDEPPLSDEDMERVHRGVEHLSEQLDVSETDALKILRETADAPGMERAQRAARWRPETEREAAWAAARLAEATAEIDRLAEQAEDWRQRIDAWFAQAARRHGRTAAFMEGVLADYGLRRRAEDPKAATIHLPSATIRTTGHKPSAEIVDEDTVADWLETLPPAVLADAGYLDRDGRLDHEKWEALVRTTRKVYVGPFRKLVAVAERTTFPATAVLACGHETDLGDHVDESSLPARGDVLFCVDCDEHAPVAEVFVGDARTRIAVLDPAGAEVPGVAVKPASTTVTVEVRR